MFDVTLPEVHAGLSLQELADLWDELLRLEKVVDEESFGNIIAAVCPNVSMPAFKRCPLKYAGIEHLYYAAQYAQMIGCHSEAIKMLEPRRRASNSQPATNLQEPEDDTPPIPRRVRPQRRLHPLDGCKRR